MDIDDIPVGKGPVKALAATMAEEPEEECFDSVATAVLLANSNWKQRRAALDRIAGSPKDGSNLSDFYSGLGKLYKEANASVLDSLFDAAVAVWEVSSESERNSLVDGMCKLVVDKGITGRTKGIASSNTFLHAVVVSGKASLVGDALLATFTHKTPKNRQAAVTTFASLVEENGLQGFPTIKALLKAVAPLCNDTNGAVRKEALNFIVQCQVYCGPTIKTFLSEHLRDVQLQELEKLFAENKPGAKKAGAAGGSGSSSAFAEEGDGSPPPPGHQRGSALPPPTMDPEAFNKLAESPVIPSLPKNLYRVALDKTEKWQDRNRIVQEGLLPLLSQPRLRASDDYMDLVKCLRDLLNDPQIPLNTTAFKGIQELARGLREGLSGNYMRYLIPAVFDKFKEKKTSIVESVYTTLGLFLANGCCGFESLQEEIDSALSSKIPHQRHAMVTWLNLIVPGINDGILRGRLCKSPHLRKLLSDDKGEVRDGALTLIGRLVAACGNEPFADLLSTLDSKQMLKVQCGSDPSFNPGNPLSSAAAAPSSPAKRRTSVVGGPSTNAPPKRSASTVTKSAAHAAAESHHADDPVAFESSLPSKAEAISKVEAALRPDAPSTLLADLASKEWKKRQDAVLALQDHVTDEVWSNNACSSILEPLVVVLGHTPGFKESIFQVATGMIGLLTLVAQRAEIITTRSAYALINGVSPKLSDMKCREPSKELLSVVAEGVGPKFVTKYLLEASGKLKQPKQLTEALSWVERSLEEFVSCPVDAKLIIAFVKANCFSSQPPAIKTAGVNLVAALRGRVGPKLEAFYEDINPHIKAAIADEFNSRSMKIEEYPTPQRQLKPSCKIDIPPPAAPARVAASPARTSRASPSRGSRHSDPSAAVMRGGGSGRSPLPSRQTGSSSSVRSSVTAQHAAAPTLPTAAAAAQFVAFAEEDAGGGDLPRTDVGPQLQALSKDIANGSDWKARLAAVKKIDALCARCHKHIGVGGVGETLKTLVGRFQEPNKNFVVDVLRTMSLLVQSAPEDGVRGAVRASLPAVLGFLGDQKQPLRDEAANFAQLGFLLLGLEPILPLVQKPITADAMFAQSAILDLLEAVFEQHILSLEQSSAPRTIPTRHITPLITPVLKLGMGRHADVRLKAEQVLVYIINMVGEDAVLKGLLDLRPAEQQSVRAMVERAMDTSNPPQNNQAVLAEEERRISEHQAAQLHRNMPVARAAEEYYEHAQVAPPHHHPQHHPVHVAAPSVVAQIHHDPYYSAPAVIPLHRPVLADLADVLDGIRTSAPEEVLMLCGDFRGMFATDKSIGRAETIEACGERLRSTLCNPRAANMSSASREMCSALIAILSSIISADVCAVTIGEGLLREIYSLIVDALMTEPPTPIVRALNEFALATVVKCPVNAGFQALLGCLNDYTVEYLNDPTSIRHRYTTLIVKCIMRLESKRVSPEVLIEACYDYLVDHPPAVFKGKDDLSIRTIKMCIGNLYKIYHTDLIKIAEKQLRGKSADGGTVLTYLRGFHDSQSPQRQRQQSTTTTIQPQPSASPSVRTDPATASPPPRAYLGGASSSYAEETSPVRTRVTAGPATVHTPSVSASHAEAEETHYGSGSRRGSISGGSRRGSMSRRGSVSTGPSAAVLAQIEKIEEVFVRARKPETSAEGVNDMYLMLKPGTIQSNDVLLAKFEACYQVCSAAFQAYLSRRMSKAFTADTSKPSDFAFPKIVTDNLDR